MQLRVVARALRRRGITSVVCALVVALVAGVPAAAQDPPDPLEEARREAERAQQRLDQILDRQRELQAKLDRAVRNFEGRRGQLGRLDEAEALAEAELQRVEERTQRTVRARDDFVRSLYKRPASTLYAWAISEGNIGAAIHRGLMVGYVLDSGAATLDRAERLRASLDERTLEVDDLRADAQTTIADLVVAQEELSALLTEMAALERAARQLVATTSARADELEALARRGGSGVMRCPIGVPNSFVDTWGAPRSGGRRHQGVDVFAPSGTELYAVADGVVDRADTLSLGGITLHLEADDGDRFYYAHLSGYAAGIDAGARVAAGQVVGYVGRSGNARTTPPHLHWEHHPEGGDAVNPYPLARELCR